MRKTFVLMFLFMVFSMSTYAQKKSGSAPNLNKSILTELGYEGVSFTKKNASAWTLKNGVTVYSSYLYGKKIRGFMGPTPLFMAVNKRKKIISMAAAPNHESPEYFSFSLPEFIKVVANDLCQDSEGNDWSKASEVSVKII